MLSESSVTAVLLFLLQFLFKKTGWAIPTVFAYVSTRMLLAAVTALVFHLIWGRQFIARLRALKTGRSIRVEDCALLAELHQKKKETPTMGGILMLSSMLVSLFLWMDLTSPFTLILFFTTVTLGAVGAYDDYLKMKGSSSKGLASKKKFGAQILIAGLVAAYLFLPSVSNSLHGKVLGKEWFSPPKVHIYPAESAQEQNPLLEGKQGEERVAAYMGRYYLPFVKHPVVTLEGGMLVVGVFFLLFVVTGSSNAVNLTDGLDGLAAGCLVIVSLALAAVAFLSNNRELAQYLQILHIEGSGEIAVYLCALAGACLGFLWYNGHPAEVFMGDTGSLALGGIIGVAAVLLRREGFLALVGAVFVLEALSVIIQVGSYKLRKGKRVFRCAPLHHHFEYKGWPETKVVLRFWVIGLVCALIGLASLKFQ